LKPTWWILHRDAFLSGLVGFFGTAMLLAGHILTR